MKEERICIGGLESFFIPTIEVDGSIPIKINFIDDLLDLCLGRRLAWTLRHHFGEFLDTDIA